jgi:hypothetical protein
MSTDQLGDGCAVVFILATMVLGAILYVCAPCGVLEWLPIDSVPGRCIKGLR